MSETGNEEMIKHRDLLQKLEHEAQEQYDKNVLYLSTGALGVSFAFLKDIVSINDAVSIWWLICAWIFWALSVTAVLYSFYSSRLAMRKAIEAFDDGKEQKDKSDVWTSCLNFASGALFVLGLFSIIVFVYNNIEVKSMSGNKKEQNQTTAMDGVNIPKAPVNITKGQNIPKAPPPPPQQQQDKK